MRHPFFYALVRTRTRAELRSQGYSRNRINDLMDSAEDGVIDVAAAQEGTTEIPIPVGAIGDGTIIKAIFDFLKSEQGQALIKALIALLIGLI